MPEMRRRTPYEVLLLARDAKSGKRVSNTLYYANPTGGAYASPVTGTSEATFLAAVIARWTTFVIPVLSINYTMVSARARVIMGWAFPSSQVLVVGATPSLTFTSITTGGPHFFLTGDAVSITGTAGVPGLNNYFSPITVTSPTTFTIPVALPGSLSTFGLVQEVEGEPEFTFEDNLEITNTSVGGIAGEAIPLYCAASVRRLNTGIGRNWRSRISLSPLGELQNENGKFSTTAFAAFETGVDSLNNGESDGVIAAMLPVVVSKTLALQEPSPFTSSDDWIRYTTDFAARRNLGSLVARKPSLTGVIA